MRGDRLLLAEQDHRFANWLQLLSGLVQFRLKRTMSDESREHLLWIKDVIGTLGLLQQQLAGAGDGHAFNRFLTEQGRLWEQFSAEQGIELVIHAEGVAVAPDKAVPLALIVNELVANCLEHAFPDERRGSIRVALAHLRDGQIELAVADDGIGLPRAAPKSRGSGLIAALVAQIGASFSIESGSGTTARVRFPAATDAPSDPGGMDHGR